MTRPDLGLLPDRIAEEMARQLQANRRKGLRHGGWVDGERAFFRQPWGLDVSQIHIPVQVWHGAKDPSYAGGEWLAAHISGVEARLTRDDGHLSIIYRHLPASFARIVESVPRSRP